MSNFFPGAKRPLLTTAQPNSNISSPLKSTTKWNSNSNKPVTKNKFPTLKSSPLTGFKKNSYRKDPAMATITKTLLSQLYFFFFLINF